MKGSIQAHDGPGIVVCFGCCFADDVDADEEEDEALWEVLVFGEACWDLVDSCLVCCLWLRRILRLTC